MRPLPAFLALPIGLALALPGPALPQAAPAPVKKVEFTGDLGFVNTAGNSDVTTFNVGDKLVIQNETKRHILTQLFGLIYGRSEGETVANNWRASGRYEYGMTPRLYLFGLLGVDRNRLAGIDRRFEEAAGLTWKALVLPRDELSFEVGASLVQQRPVVGVDDNYVAGRTSALYKHLFRENTAFTQLVEFLPNFETGDDYRINSESALVASLSRNLAFKVAYVIRFDNLPEPGFEDMDRILTTGLQIAY